MPACLAARKKECLVFTRAVATPAAICPSPPPPSAAKPAAISTTAKPTAASYLRLRRGRRRPHRRHLLQALTRATAQLRLEKSPSALKSDSAEVAVQADAVVVRGRHSG